MQFYELLLLIFTDDKECGMKAGDIIEELNKSIKPENITAEDVFYYAGVIECIKEIKKLALKNQCEE